MTWNYAVTFEFELQAPLTHRGTVTASSTPPAARKALTEAKKAHPGIRPTSIVVLLDTK